MSTSARTRSGGAQVPQPVQAAVDAHAEPIAQLGEPLAEDVGPLGQGTVGAARTREDPAVRLQPDSDRPCAPSVLLTAPETGAIRPAIGVIPRFCSRSPSRKSVDIRLHRVEHQISVWCSTFQLAIPLDEPVPLVPWWVGHATLEPLRLA
jgi:hypothetical protein